MARKLALTASGPLSGKSTLAKHLRDVYGFMVVDHATNLVRLFVEEWNLNRPYNGEGGQLTVETVQQYKEQFRQGLQEFSLRIGYSDPNNAEYWTRKTLEPWYEAGEQRDVAFDPFRGEVQAGVMRNLGFTLVQVEISDTVRCIRAGLMGKNCKAVLDAMNAHPELERGIAHPDIRLNGELPVDVLGRILMHRGEGSHGYQIFGSHVG